MPLSVLALHTLGKPFMFLLQAQRRMSHILLLGIPKPKEMFALKGLETPKLALIKYVFLREIEFGDFK